MTIRRPFALMAVLTLAVAACGGDDGGGSDGSDESPASGVVSVAALSAMEPVLADLIEAFQADNPDAEIDVAVYDEAVELRAAAARDAIIVGATDVVTDVSAEAPIHEEFGRDLFLIFTPPGNPGGIEGLASFGAEAGKRVRACAPEIAYGNLAEVRLASDGVFPADGVVGTGCEEEAVGQLVSGDLDGLLAFRSIVGANDEIDSTEISPDETAIRVDYAVLVDDDTAEAFAGFIESDEGQAIRTEHGWLP